MNVQAQKLDLNNIIVDNSSSKEATVLRMIADPPTRIYQLGFNKSDSQLDILKVYNSTFTNIIANDNSILFDINLERVKQNVKTDLRLNFDRVKVENAFSLKSGALFKIYGMNDEIINISNSNFSCFKSGSREQFIQYLNRYQYAFERDKKDYKLMTRNFQNYSQNHTKKKPGLIIQNCNIDNLGVVNRFVSSLQYSDFYKSRNIKRWNNTR